MARKEKQQANSAVNTENQQNQQYNQQAQTLMGTLAPAYTQMATSPTGYSATDLAGMNTASQQSIGGSVAGAVGEGKLADLRTRNAGGSGEALDEAVRSGQRQLSENALGIQGKNADLKEQQRQEGLAGLRGLYGQDVSASLGALGLVPGTINAGTNAENSGWLQNTEGVLNSLTGGYKAFKRN
jgi:hypothetical protein